MEIVKCITIWRYFKALQLPSVIDLRSAKPFSTFLNLRGFISLAPIFVKRAAALETEHDFCNNHHVLQLTHHLGGE